MFDVIGYAHDKLEDLSISAKRRVMTVLELLKDPSKWNVRVTKKKVEFIFQFSL